MVSIGLGPLDHAQNAPGFLLSTSHTPSSWTFLPIVKSCQGDLVMRCHFHRLSSVLSKPLLLPLLLMLSKTSFFAIRTSLLIVSLCWHFPSLLEYHPSPPDHHPSPLDYQIAREIAANHWMVQTKILLQRPFCALQ